MTPVYIVPSPRMVAESWCVLGIMFLLLVGVAVYYLIEKRKIEKIIKHPRIKNIKTK